MGALIVFCTPSARRLLSQPSPTPYCPFSPSSSSWPFFLVFVFLRSFRHPAHALLLALGHCPPHISRDAHAAREPHAAIIRDYAGTQRLRKLRPNQHTSLRATLYLKSSIHAFSRRFPTPHGSDPAGAQPGSSGKDGRATGLRRGRRRGMLCGRSFAPGPPGTQFETRTKSVCVHSISVSKCLL